jgi:hypothetical protein
MIETVGKEILNPNELFGLCSRVFRYRNQQILDVSSGCPISDRGFEFADLLQLALCILKDATRRRISFRPAPAETIQSTVDTGNSIDNWIAAGAIPMALVKATCSAAGLTAVAIRGPKTSCPHKS